MFTGTGDKRFSVGGNSPEHTRQRTTSLAEALQDSNPPPQPIPALPGFLVGGDAGGSVGAAAASGSGAPAQVAQMVDLRTLELMLERQNECHRCEMAEMIRTLREVQQPAAVSPVVASASASPAAVSAVSPGSQKEHLKQSKVVSMKFVSEGAKLKKLLHRVSLAKDFCTKLEEQLSSLAKAKIPAQLRPFKLPFQSEAWSELVGTTDLKMLIGPVSENESFEQAALRLHVEYLASHTILMLTVQRKKLASLKDEASLEHFTQNVLAEATLEFVAMESTVEGTSSPSSEGFAAALELEVRKACEICYNNQGRAIASEKLAADKKKALQREREQKALDRAAQLPREEVIRRGLREILHCKGPRSKNKGDVELENKVVDFKKLLNVDVAVVSEEARRETTYPLPKNGASPGDGRGQNVHQNQKGKGQKSGNAKAKAKAGPTGKAGGKGSGASSSSTAASKAQAKHKPKPKQKAGGNAQSKGQKSGGKGNGKGGKK